MAKYDKVKLTEVHWVVTNMFRLKTHLMLDVTGYSYKNIGF